MYTPLHHICGVMDSVLALSEVDRGFDFRSGQTKDFEIGICCFSAKHIAWRRKSKDWLAEKNCWIGVKQQSPTHAHPYICISI